MITKDVESFADFLQYYSHRFVLAKNDPALMYFVDGPADHHRPARRAYMTAYRNGDNPVQDIYNEEQLFSRIQFGLPSIGMTVFNDRELIYLYYRTTRAGSRGFGGDRISQHSFNGWNLQNYGLGKFNPADLSRAWAAWGALNPKHVTLEAAWKDLNSAEPNALAYSLNSRFGVYLSHKEEPRLCYKMLEIGDVLGPNKVRLDSRQAEYRELIRRTLNPDMEIEIK